MGIFQETWRDIAAFRPHKLQDGSFEYVRLRSAGLYKANPEVVATRGTGAFVEALVFHHPPGTDVLGAREIISKLDYTALWGRIIGVKVVTRDVDEEYLRFLPGVIPIGLSEPNRETASQISQLKVKPSAATFRVRPFITFSYISFKRWSAQGSAIV